MFKNDGTQKPRARTSKTGTMPPVTTQTVQPVEGRRRFLAETLEAAIALATEELGPDLRVISANRKRRGGFAGFFATEIGIEIEVETGSTPSVAPVATDSSVTNFGSGVDGLLANRVDRFIPTELAESRSGSLPRQLRQPSDVADLVAERIGERERQAQQRADDARIRELEAREQATVAAGREAEARVLMESAAERERVASVTASLDAERRRSAQLEVERDRALDQAMTERISATVELTRLQAESEQTAHRAEQLRNELGRAERERGAAALQADLMRDALRRGREDALETPKASDNDSYGMQVLSRMGVPELILRQVRNGTPLSRAIPAAPVVGDPGSTGGLIVLVGPRQLILERQRQLAERCNVRTSDMAFATMREVVDRNTYDVRVLCTDNDVSTWVDGRLEPRRTSIIAVEWNASPGWTTGVRRVGRGAANGSWRIVLPASYPAHETRTLIGALGAYKPVIDVVGAQQTTVDCAQMLEFADKIATVDGEPHSGALWASLLWERACRF